VPECSVTKFPQKNYRRASVCASRKFISKTV
jgi:hypothetical protein